MAGRKGSELRAGQRKAERRRTAGETRAETVKHIRRTLGRTQAELASALGVSEKAVQSYEQGWRNVPVRVLIQLLVLVALYRKQALEDIPCWELRKCTLEQREECPSFTVGRGQFCWFIGNKKCRPEPPDALDPALPCMECPVVQRILTVEREMT